MRFRTTIESNGRTATGFEVPEDTVAALQRSPAARTFFDGRSYSKQRWFTESVTSAKKPETRSRRVDKAIELLEAGTSGG
jgi:uncharacterized protein YdeI (YjbR/CyaY-like superfamily)